MVVWTPGEEGNRLELRWLWRHAYELDGEVDRLLESESESKSLDEWIKSAKPAWWLDVDPDSAGTGSNFRFALGLSRRGSVGWLEGLAQAGEADVVEGKDEVTVRVPARRKTTVIDRNTGFILSIRNDFESGEARILTVNQVKTGTPKPEVKLPAKVNERSPSIEETMRVIATELSGHLRGALRRILDRWERVGAPERAESLQTFFSAAAARRDAACRQAAYRKWADTFVEQALRRGISLDDMASDVDDKAADLKEYLDRGEAHYQERFTGFNADFKEQILKVVRESSGSEEAKRTLATRIKEGFDPDRVEKARAKMPGPDSKALLRQAMEEAKAKK